MRYKNVFKYYGNLDDVIVQLLIYMSFMKILTFFKFQTTEKKFNSSNNFRQMAQLSFNCVSTCVSFLLLFGKLRSRIARAGRKEIHMRSHNWEKAGQSDENELKNWTDFRESLKFYASLYLEWSKLQKAHYLE